MGSYSLVQEIGPSWVVLDEAQRSLRKLDWFDQVFDGEPRGEALEFPIGDEETYVRLSPDVARISQGLATLGPDSEACRSFPDAIAGLRRLIASAGGSNERSLVCRTLL